jgi:hypothetical protein
VFSHYSVALTTAAEEDVAMPWMVVVLEADDPPPPPHPTKASKAQPINANDWIWVFMSRS